MSMREDIAFSQYIKPKSKSAPTAAAPPVVSAGGAAASVSAPGERGGGQLGGRSHGDAPDHERTGSHPGGVSELYIVLTHYYPLTSRGRRR